MAQLLFADGLGQYANIADMLRRFLTGNAGEADVASYTRTNGVTAKEVAGWFWNFSGRPGALQVGLTPATPTQGSLMIRCRFTSLGGAGTCPVIVKDTNGTPHLSVIANANGSLSVVRADPTGTVLATSAAAVVTTTVRYAIELKWTIHDTTGNIGLRVNEVEVATFTGDTRNGATGAWGIIDIGCDGSSARSVYVGDIHIADATGGLAYLGDMQTDPHYPNGVGTTTGGTPSAGLNWQCVDDVNSNGDTDYVSMTAPGLTDTYAVENFKSPGSTIVAVTPVIDVKKVDSGTARFKTVARSGGTDYASTTELSPSAGSYRYLEAGPLRTDPATGLAWTEVNFNAAEFGFTKTA